MFPSEHFQFVSAEPKLIGSDHARSCLCSPCPQSPNLRALGDSGVSSVSAQLLHLASSLSHPAIVLAVFGAAVEFRAFPRLSLHGQPVLPHLPVSHFPASSVLSSQRLKAPLPFAGREYSGSSTRGEPFRRENRLQGLQELLLCRRILVFHYFPRSA